MIYSALSEELSGGVHALSLKTRTEGEEELSKKI
jgi:stress-induced morphogen